MNICYINFYSLYAHIVVAIHWLFYFSIDNLIFALRIIPCPVHIYWRYASYCVAQNFDRESIDEFDKFLSIRQHFPYQNFPLIISSAVCMPDHFFVKHVIAGYSIRAHAVLFPACKYI